jgi:hypothetical protein
MIGAFIGGVITGIVICCMALFLWCACTLASKADACEEAWMQAHEKELDLEARR